MPAGFALGVSASLLITVLGAALIAKLVDRETIGEGSIGYGILIVMILASWLGSLVSYGRIKRRRAVVCLAAGGIYFLVLLSFTALFFGGEYSGVGVTALLIFCGSMLAVLPGLRQNRGGKRPKIKIPNG